MAAEIVFDDGGSTRIKQLGADLDKIMDIDPNAVGTGPVPTAPGSNVQAFGDFDLLRVVTVGNGGVTVQTDISIAPSETFQLVSHWHQRIHGKLVAAAGGVAAHCLLTVYGINDVEPIVTGKRLDGQRRYVIENAGRIIKIVAPGNDITIDPGANPYTAVFLRKA